MRASSGHPLKGKCMHPILSSILLQAGIHWGFWSAMRMRGTVWKKEGHQVEGTWAWGWPQRAEEPWQPVLLTSGLICEREIDPDLNLSRFVLGSLVLVTQPLSSYTSSLERLENVSSLSPRWANLSRSQQRNFVYLLIKQKQAKHKWDTWLHAIFGFWSLSLEWKAEEETVSWHRNHKCTEGNIMWIAASCGGGGWALQPDTSHPVSTT